MTHLNRKQKKVLFIGIGILMVVIFVGGFLIFYSPIKKNLEEPILDNRPIEPVLPEQALDMYSTLTKECSGALVWNLAVGEKIEIDNLADTNACHNDNYYSKMVGYTYNDVGVVLHVNVLKRVENNLYKIDDTYVGVYDDTTINGMLDNGTTYEYVFEQLEDGYKLIQVNLMPVS